MFAIHTMTRSASVGSVTADRGHMPASGASTGHGMNAEVGVANGTIRPDSAPPTTTVGSWAEDHEALPITK